MFTYEGNITKLKNSYGELFSSYLFTTSIGMHILNAAKIALSSHCILLGPGSSSGFILGSICLVHVSNLRHKRIIWIWVSQQGANGEQHLRDC